MTESEAYRKYFQPFVQRGDLDTSPTMLLGAMTSGACRGGWLGGWGSWARRMLRWLHCCSLVPGVTCHPCSLTTACLLNVQLTCLSPRLHLLPPRRPEGAAAVAGCGDVVPRAGSARGSQDCGSR